MNWFDSRSISGFLSQAQKSIDKVLDIPSQEEGEKEKEQNTTEPQRDHYGKSSGEKKLSNSWLSGEDSFWGSFVTQTETSDRKKESKTTEKKTQETKNNEPRNKEIKQTKQCVLSEKSAKPSSISQNSKRSNGKRSSKKKKATDSSEQQSEKKSLPKKEVGILMQESSDQNKLQLTENKVLESNVKLSKEKVLPSGSELKVEEGYVVKNEEKSTVIRTESAVDDYLKTPADNVSHSLTKNDKICQDLITNQELNYLKENKKETLDTENSTDVSEDVLQNASSENSYKDVHLHVQGERPTERPTEMEVDGSSEMVNVVETTKGKYENSEVKNEIDYEESDSFYSAPVASSTPYTSRKKEISTHDNDLKEENDITVSKQELIKTIKTSENHPTTSDIKTECVKETDMQSEVVNLNKDFVEDMVPDTDSKSLRKENERLCQIIEVRESKLVALSKENLDLQETNAILRSQLEQLEEVHKTEDSEFEQMKEEFTKRIANTESKLQVASKERDLFKKELEETQQCLSSDIERQLKEFQLLSKQKDEQIAQLMEEGEKLSKDILQRNNNIKKLRAKEKEINEINENQSKRLEEAESEIERLMGILKERDEHKKEQDDAIKKLNSYIKKQDEQIAKQKTELEESGSKLPSLQTALDNAYKEITELHKVNAAKSNAVQEATLSVEMTAKEELRIAMERLKKESQKECDVLALEVTDLQTQLSRSEQQAARREDNLRQEIADLQMRLQEAETRNQELTQSVSVATRPLLRQIENLQNSYGSQQASWEKVEKNLTERLAEAQSLQATAQEKERAAAERLMELSSRVAGMESQVANYRKEKSRIEAELEMEKAKSEALEEFKSKETGKIEALKAMQSKQLESMLVEKTLLEQQLVVERSKFESEQKKLSRLEDQLKDKSQRVDLFSSKNEYAEKQDEEDVFAQAPTSRGRSRNTSTSSQMSLSETLNRSLPSGSTAMLEEVHATIRHKEGELSSMQSAISTLEASRESLTKELTTLVATNENLKQENERLGRLDKSFQELQTKYNALLQMYGEKEEETEELKLDLQDIKIMYKTQIQELLSGR